MNYDDFILEKSQIGQNSGFAPRFIPDKLFDFQKHLLEWSVKKGRAGVFANCGLGKSPMQLAWAQNMVEHTNKPGLILTPLAVGPQTVREGEKFGIECHQSRDGTIKGKITVTNYQQLHKFNAADFEWCVCDESSCLKDFDAETTAQVTEFMRNMKYRSMWTATAAPNDYIELGTHSEALGGLGFRDMLSKFFKKDEKALSRSHEYRSGTFRFRGHAKRDFWRWVCSWARACRMPSDLGFSDDGFILPPLTVVEHLVKSSFIPKGDLLPKTATGLKEQRQERRQTIQQRCETVAKLVSDTPGQSLSWCHLNDEGDLLAELIPNSKQICGDQSDEEKEEILSSWLRGEFENLVSKPKIIGFGINAQNCAHQTFFPSHSFEQWYQAIRRSWRFGQKNTVKIDVISSEGESGVLKNLKRKADAADEMFKTLVALMRDELSIERIEHKRQKITLPNWL